MFNELAERIVKINKANGWNVLTPGDADNPYRIPTALCLIHSEITEAWQAYHIGDRKNFEEELADIEIRTLDMMGGLGYDIEAWVTFGSPKTELGKSLNDIGRMRCASLNMGWSVVEWLMWLHTRTDLCLEHFRRENGDGFRFEAAMLLLDTLAMGHEAKVDMDRQVAAKLEKNAQRGYRHGGKKV